MPSGSAAGGTRLPHRTAGHDLLGPLTVNPGIGRSPDHRHDDRGFHAGHRVAAPRSAWPGVTRRPRSICRARSPLRKLHPTARMRSFAARSAPAPRPGRHDMNARAASRAGVPGLSRHSPTRRPTRRPPGSGLPGGLTIGSRSCSVASSCAMGRPRIPRGSRRRTVSVLHEHPRPPTTTDRGTIDACPCSGTTYRLASAVAKAFDDQRRQPDIVR